MASSRPVDLADASAVPAMWLMRGDGSMSWSTPPAPTCPAASRRRRPRIETAYSGLIAAAAAHGENVGIYAERILDDPLPWTRMRAVYRLLGLVRRYGPGPVDTACSRALDLHVVSVTKIASML